MQPDFEHSAMVEANQLTDKQYDDFMGIIETIPAKRSPISGQVARLGFEFMEDTGLRITEMLHVTKQDIDFDTRILTVTHPKSKKQCKCSTWKYKDNYTRIRILEYADPECKICHGLGKWRKPQRTTITPRIVFDLEKYCETLIKFDKLWPVSRQSFYTWGKMAGTKAGINIFQQKDEKLIQGIFLHLFRALCAKRVTKDARQNQFQNQLIDTKLRHSVKLRDRYNRPDINYLLSWEQKFYTQ